MSLETRARKNGRAIDLQAIREGETREFRYGYNHDYDHEATLEEMTEEAMAINKLLDSIVLEDDKTIDLEAVSVEANDKNFSNMVANMDETVELDETKAKIEYLKNHLDQIYGDDYSRTSSRQR